MSGPRAPWWLLGLVVMATSPLAGCIENRHPLADSGSAEFFVDAAPIYAADVLDDSGHPVLPRQKPYLASGQLFLSAGNAADEGGYVDVQLKPPGALSLLAVDDTCEQLAGAFRCTAAHDGYANFAVRSDSDWSGSAELSLVGRASRGETATVTVNPAGLPAEASNFELIIEGVEGSRVPARFTSLACIVNPVPDSSFDKWPEGKTRVRAASIRATAPPSAPTVIEHAPVIIDTLHAEAFVTLDPSCPRPHDSRMRVQLDAQGRSPGFYFCFSDLGGSQVGVAAHSGALSLQRSLEVELEPRLLRVVTIKNALTVGDIDEGIAEVTAFNSEVAQVSFTIDVRSSDPSVLAVSSPTEKLALEGGTTTIRVTPLKAGVATIQITPQLLDSPRCESTTITVLEP